MKQFIAGILEDLIANVLTAALSICFYSMFKHGLMELIEDINILLDKL